MLWGGCQRRPPPLGRRSQWERPAPVWLTPFVSGIQKPSREAVVSSGLRAGWEIPVELGKGQARTRSNRALSEEGRGEGGGPHGTAGLGSDFRTWEEEIDGRHQEDSEVLVRAGLPRNKSRTTPAPPAPSSLAAPPLVGLIREGRGGAGMSQPYLRAQGQKPLLILLLSLCWCLL